MKKSLSEIARIFQRSEITEYYIYSLLAKRAKGKNRNVLKSIAKDEMTHYDFWKKFTGTDIRPGKFKIAKYYLIYRILGMTFSIKLMEKGEDRAEAFYRSMIKKVPRVARILNDETRHEQLLIDMIEEEKLNYIGSMVLGLNDALVELTGALAGLTFALQNTRLIYLAGIITGISASLSMAASEYLSKKSEKGSKNPFKASLYTGLAYIVTVLFLTLPYLIYDHYYMALGFTLVHACLVILFFTFFVSIVKEISLKKMFFEMLSLSLGVAGISFFIGILARKIIHVDI